MFPRLVLIATSPKPAETKPSQRMPAIGSRKNHTPINIVRILIRYTIIFGIIWILESNKHIGPLNITDSATIEANNAKLAIKYPLHHLLRGFLPNY